MLRIGKLTLAALTATMLLGLAVSNASANHLSTNELGFRITWASLEFSETVFRIGIRCPVTLEGAFSSATIAKVTGAAIGSVNRVTVRNESCTGGHATALTERLPWRITYEAFTGTLPRITGIKVLLIRPAFRIEVAGIINCLSEPARILGIIIGAIEAGGAFKPESLTPEREVNRCGEINGVFGGTGVVSRAGSTARTLITLI